MMPMICVNGVWEDDPAEPTTSYGALLKGEPTTENAMRIPPLPPFAAPVRSDLRDVIDAATRCIGELNESYQAVPAGSDDEATIAGAIAEVSKAVADAIRKAAENAR